MFEMCFDAVKTEARLAGAPPSRFGRDVGQYQEEEIPSMYWIKEKEKGKDDGFDSFLLRSLTWRLRLRGDFAEGRRALSGTLSNGKK